MTIQKQQEYENLMKEAAKDEVFIERTMDAQNDFLFADEEVDAPTPPQSSPYKR